MSSTAACTDAACLRPQKCPFDAIMIINLPKNLEKETTHRYGPNSFKLHRWAWALCSSAGGNSVCCKLPGTWLQACQDCRRLA